MKHKWKLDENGKPDEWAWESGFHNGVYCECCGKTVCIHCDSDWELMNDCPGDIRKPKTNTDRIRAMSDEELAEFLNRVKEPCDYCQLAVVEGACTETLCDDAMTKWLKQPAEG